MWYQIRHLAFNPSSPTTGNGDSIRINTSTNQNVISSSTSVSQKQRRQPQVILVPAQHQNRSSLANTALQQPYQSQAPYPYQSQAPYPYQNQAPYPYQSQATYQKQQSLTTQPPVANAGMSQTVSEGTTVTLDGRASYTPIIGNGGIAAYQWTQLPIGIPVTLRGATTPTFTTPVALVDTPLAFNLRVIDNHGTASTNPAVVYVMIKHNPTNTPITRGNNADTGNQGHQGQSLPPNNIIGATSQPNSPRSQIVSPNTLNAFPSRVR